MENIKLLTVKELCETLKISRMTVYRYIKEGMPYEIVGKHKRFEVAKTLHWFKTKK